MYLTKTDKGYIPSSDSDLELSKKIKVGTEVYATKARNVQMHRKGFALLKLGYENQDNFDEFEIYRSVLTMKAGFVHWVKGTDGKEYPMPKSLSFDKMSQEEFEKWYVAVRNVISKSAKIKGADIDAELFNFY